MAKRLLNSIFPLDKILSSASLPGSPQKPLRTGDYKSVVIPPYMDGLVALLVSHSLEDFNVSQSMKIITLHISWPLLMVKFMRTYGLAISDILFLSEFLKLYLM